MSSYAPIPMIPGPVSLHPKVIEAMSKDYPSGQVDEEFLQLYASTGKKLATIMNTQNDIVMMTGEGMLALWGALKSCLKVGDSVVTVGTGVFGDGMADMALSIGCHVEKISLPYDQTIGCGNSLERIEETLRRIKPKMVTAVHCETPSGTINPLEELGKIKEQLGIPLFYVDAVASAGGSSIPAEHIDLLLAGSQKCLSAPPSMSIVGVSETAWDIMKKVGYQGYDAIYPFKTVQEDGRCPYTPYWHGIAALNAAADVLLDEGLEKTFARHEAVAKQCRSGLEELGIKLFPTPEANDACTVTAAYIPKKFSFKEWQKTLAEKGLIITGSFGPMAGKIFRLGHMGTQADTSLMDKALRVIKQALMVK